MSIPIDRACVAVVGITIVFTTGCVRYRPAPLFPEAAAAALESRVLEDPGLRAFAISNTASQRPWPPETLDLDALTIAAFYFHPDLDVARARWAVARAGVVTAGARPNPALNLASEYVTQTEAPSPWILGFSLDIPIDTFGKRGYRVSQARALSESARVDIASVAWRVRSRLRSALLDLWTAEARADLVRRELALREEILQMLERRLEVGEAARTDVTRERIAAERARFSVRDAARLAADARARVAGAIGVAVEALDSRTLSFAGFEVAPSSAELALPAVRRAALVGRADVRSLLAEYTAAQAALQLEVARQYPDLKLGPGYTWEQGEHRFAFGVSLVLPSFNRNRGPIAEAEARRSEVAARFAALQSQVLADIDAGIQSYRPASDAFVAAETALAAQRQAAAQIAERFRAGEADRLDLRTAELEVVAMEQARFDALLARQRLLAALENALQRPLSGSERPLPSLEAAPRATREESR